MVTIHPHFMCQIATRRDNQKSNTDKIGDHKTNVNKNTELIGLKNATIIIGVGSITRKKRGTMNTE